MKSLQILTLFGLMVNLYEATDLKIYDFEGIQQNGLRWHNYYRHVFELKPLELHQALTNLAQTHAEELAEKGSLNVASIQLRQNLWSYRGPFVQPEQDLEYAVKSWYTGSLKPGDVTYSIDYFVLRSNEVKYVGFGLGKNPKTDYTVVVAMYM